MLACLLINLFTNLFTYIFVYLFINLLILIYLAIFLFIYLLGELYVFYLFIFLYLPLLFTYSSNHLCFFHYWLIFLLIRELRISIRRHHNLTSFYFFIITLSFLEKLGRCIHLATGDPLTSHSITQACWNVIIEHPFWGAAEQVVVLYVPRPFPSPRSGYGW